MLEYKYLGLLAIIILVTGLVFIMLKWPQGRHSSFSQHVAIRRHTIVYYSLLFGVVLPLLLLFFLRWFMPEFELSAWFGFFIVASSLFQFACTLIPEIGGWKTRYHRLLAGTSAVLLMPALLILLLSDSVELLSKLLTIISLAIMLGTIYVLSKGKGQHQQFLLLQSAYFAAFFIPILFTAYVQ
jgi:hypothetical protein